MKRNILRCAALSFAVWYAAAALAADKPQAGPMSAALHPFLEDHTLAGAVTLIASGEKILGVETMGYADLKAKQPMRADSLFWIASQSKPITAAALMILVDEGKVKIDDPVEKYLPEFKGQWVAVEQDKDHILLKRPLAPITVKNVLTHTSGLPATSPMEKPTLDVLPLRDAVRSHAMSPLQFQPGSKYNYSNAGINTAGRIIEVVSGMPYEKFLEQRLFVPLRMTDTTFRPNAKQLRRLAKSYKINAAKELEETPIAQLYYPLDAVNRCPMPAGGLFSTAADLARFCQMVMAGGAYQGKRLISEAAVKQMTSVETGDIKINNNDSTGYGFGWSVLRKPAGDGRAAGSFGHGGAYKTTMWIDPQKRLIMVLMRQHSGQDGNKIEGTFLRTVIEKFGK